MTTEFQVGDKVAYARNFIRSIGAYTGEIPFARGVVTDVTVLSRGQCVIATVDWGCEDSRVNVKNLVLVSEIHKELV